MKHGISLRLMVLAAVCAGCASSTPPTRETGAAVAPGKSDCLLEKEFVLEVLRYVYRWHFDQSYVLEAGKVNKLEVWSRRLHPALDADDRSDYGELWIPAVKTLVELKRAEYKVPELKLDSSVCNEVWVFWETGRKVMLFSADMDLSNPGFSQLSQLRMQVIDLDKDVVASTREVPGSNAFVTKDWVGRLFFNCILYGEKLVRSPEELSRLRAAPAIKPGP